MEILIYWVIAVLVGAIFLPEYDGGEFRNIPLFIIIVSGGYALYIALVVREKNTK